MSLSALSVSGLAISLSDVGAIVGIPINSVTALMGFVAVGFGIAGKTFNRKISKHEKLIFLAKAKNRTISRLVSQALVDGIISDSEFNIILNEMDQYYEMKVSYSDKNILGKTTPWTENRNAKANNKEDEIRKQINEEIREKYKKARLSSKFKRITVNFIRELLGFL